MRIIARRIQPITSITADILHRRKSQKEIIDEIVALKKQTPRGRFFTHLEREFGKKEVIDFKQALIEAEKQYHHFKALEEIYTELHTNSPLGLYQQNLVGHSVPKLSIYASSKEDIIYQGKNVGYIVLSKRDYGYNIDDIYVMKSGHKIGTSRIQEEMKKAKANNYILTLTSDAMRGKLSQKKNRALYTKLGFIRNSKETRIKKISEEFYYPKQ